MSVRTFGKNLQEFIEKELTPVTQALLDARGDKDTLSRNAGKRELGVWIHGFVNQLVDAFERNGGVRVDPNTGTTTGAPAAPSADPIPVEGEIV